MAGFQLCDLSRALHALKLVTPHKAVSPLRSATALQIFRGLRRDKRWGAGKMAAVIDRPLQGNLATVTDRRYTV